MILTGGVLLVIIVAIKYLKKLTIDYAKLSSILGVIYFLIQIYRVLSGNTLDLSGAQIGLLKGPIEWIFNVAVPGVVDIIRAGFGMLLELIPDTVNFFKEVLS